MSPFLSSVLKVNLKLVQFQLSSCTLTVQHTLTVEYVHVCNWVCVQFSILYTCPLFSFKRMLEFIPLFQTHEQTKLNVNVEMWCSSLCLLYPCIISIKNHHIYISQTFFHWPVMDQWNVVKKMLPRMQNLRSLGRPTSSYSTATSPLSLLSWWLSWSLRD